MDQRLPLPAVREPRQAHLEPVHAGEQGLGRPPGAEQERRRPEDQGHGPQGQGMLRQPRDAYQEPA